MKGNQEVRKLLNEYTQIIGKLKKIGVVRSGKVVGDYGEYIASKKLGLNLVDNSVNKGYDATDCNGRKYEIKTRKATAWNKPNIFPINPTQISCIDFLIYIEFDNMWNIVKLLKIPAIDIRVNKYNRVCITQDLVERYSVL